MGRRTKRSYWIVSVHTGDVYVVHNSEGVGVSRGLKVFETEEEAEAYGESVRSKKKKRR